MLWTSLLLIAAFASTPGSPTGPSNTPPASEASVQEVEQRFATTLIARDQEHFGPLLSSTLRHIGFEGQIVGKTEYMDFFKHGDWRYSSYEPSEVSVKMAGSVAVVTGRIKRSIVVGGKATSGAFAFTHVWFWGNGSWLLESSQVTATP